MKRFLPASLLLHALLLGALAAWAPPHPTLALRTLALELPSARSAAHPVQPATAPPVAAARRAGGGEAPARQATRPRPHRSKPLATARMALTDPAAGPPARLAQNPATAALPPPASVAAAPSQPATRHEDTATSQVRAALYAALRARFVYPRRARLRGWQGTVRVGVRVSAAGRILQLRIVESSHHAVLDRAALDCLDRIRQVPGAVAWLDGRARDIVVPIEYRLTDG